MRGNRQVERASPQLCGYGWAPCSLCVVCANVLRALAANSICENGTNASLPVSLTGVARRHAGHVVTVSDRLRHVLSPRRGLHPGDGRQRLQRPGPHMQLQVGGQLQMGVYHLLPCAAAQVPAAAARAFLWKSCLFRRNSSTQITLARNKRTYSGTVFMECHTKSYIHNVANYKVQPSRFTRLVQLCIRSCTAEVTSRCLRPHMAIREAPTWFSSERRIDTRLAGSPCGDGPYEGAPAGSNIAAEARSSPTQMSCGV